MSAAAVIPSPPAIESARHYHASGDLLQAAQAYRQTLLSNPQSQPALFGLSLLARQSNQLQPALHMAQAALASCPSNPLAWANLGDILTALQQTAQAESVYRRALQLDPSIAAAHYGLGNTLALQENFPAALTSFRTAAQLNPAIPEFHFAAAFALSKLGDHTQAIAAYRRAVTRRPGFASAWLNLGVELIADGRPNLACLCYRETLAAATQNPNSQISAHLNLGHLARSRRGFTRAAEHYNRALTLAPPDHPRHAEIQVAFTYLHLEQKQLPEAWQSLQKAESADADPRNPEVPNVRGILLLAEDSASPDPLISTDRVRVPQVSTLRLGSDADPKDSLHLAIAAFGQAEALGHKTAASNRGNALLRLGRCEEALTAQQAAVTRDPHHPGVRYNLALTQLRLGDFAHGWPNYEIRWSFREVHPSPRRFHQPRWQGEPLARSSALLIYAEQGLGDTLQFVRYLTLVTDRLARSAGNPGSGNAGAGNAGAGNAGAPHLDFEMWDQQQVATNAQARTILEVQPPLTRLLTSHFASVPALSVQVITHGDPLPRFTHHCPLMSLPAIFHTTPKFHTTPESVPNQIPYLDADPDLVKARGREISARHPAVGIAWAGNPNYRADRERSTHVETFLPLLQIPNIHWISLQKSHAASQISQLPPHISLYDGCSRDIDFGDTAALVSNLDLVITTDTAVAHLAGALGKPLWLLLPWQSDWRWMQHRLTTPWYPQARLFRQSSPNNWAELIQRVARELPSAFARATPTAHKSS